MATLKQEILDDLDAIFDGGLTLDITHVNGIVNETIKGFFDNPYSTGLVGEGDIENPNPSILIKTEDSGNIDEDSNFTILGVVYYPGEIESDVEGVKKITLSKDANK